MVQREPGEWYLGHKGANLQCYLLRGYRASDHSCNEHELGQTLGDGEVQGGPCGHKESDRTGRLNDITELQRARTTRGGTGSVAGAVTDFFHGWRTGQL